MRLAVSPQWFSLSSLFSQNRGKLFQRTNNWSSRWKWRAGRWFKDLKGSQLVLFNCWLEPHKWVSDKIRYDQSTIERVLGLPSLQNVQGVATAKPIRAHPTLGCPFAMYQNLSVTQTMISWAAISFQQWVLSHILFQAPAASVPGVFHFQRVYGNGWGWVKELRSKS